MRRYPRYVSKWCADCKRWFQVLDWVGHCPLCRGPLTRTKR
jgi:Zn finger protein HypA/HybF involved in hydrogenase expression